MVEAQKLHGLEDQPLVEENSRVDPSISPYNEWGLENMRQSEFHACIEKRVDQNCNCAYEEDVDLDDNYDHFS